MARMLYPINCLEAGVVEIGGLLRFVAADTVVTTQVGTGFTAVKNNTGLVDITFDDAYPTFLGATLTGIQAAADDKFWEVVSFTAATRVLQIRCYDISTTAAAHPLAGDGVTFRARFKQVSY